MSDRGGGEFVLGFLVGVLAGTVAALLLTPYSGEEMRSQIKEKGVELKEQAEQAMDEAKHDVEKLGEKGRIVLSDNVQRAQQAVQEAQEKLSSSEA